MEHKLTIPEKKIWAKPDFYIIDTNPIKSGTNTVFHENTLVYSGSALFGRFGHKAGFPSQKSHYFNQYVS